MLPETSLYVPAGKSIQVARLSREYCILVTGPEPLVFPFIKLTVALFTPATTLPDVGFEGTP